MLSIVISSIPAASVLCPLHVKLYAPWKSTVNPTPAINWAHLQHRGSYSAGPLGIIQRAWAVASDSIAMGRANSQAACIITPGKVFELA